MIEMARAVSGREQWTTHKRGLPQNEDSLVGNGSIIYVPRAKEVVSYHEAFDGLDMRVDESGDGKIIRLYHFQPEKSGLQLRIAKILDRFDQTKIGQWLNAEPDIRG